MATLKGAYEKGGRNLLPIDLGLIDDGAIVFDNGEILWVGKSGDLPLCYRDLPARNCQGMALLPELVDAHTHLIFGGDRASEYVKRLNGVDYRALAQTGGGILETVRGTRKLSRRQLFALSVERIERIHSYGIGTIDIKSGYGLSLEKERELTWAIDDLKRHFAPRVQIHNTYMAAHAVPQEFHSSSRSSADYVEEVVFPLLDELAPHGIIDAVDIFHEEGYFGERDVRALFEKACDLGIPRKIHADEFADNGGAFLAVEYGALSADHLLATGAKGIRALAKSGTVVVLLPGTGYFLGKDQALARTFLDEGCRVAMASDYNPGSCHCDNLLWLASMAAVAPQYRMNIAEFWGGLTLNGAAALGFHRQGALLPGLIPRFSLFKAPSVAHISYCWGANLAFLD